MEEIEAFLRANILRAPCTEPFEAGAESGYKTGIAHLQALRQIRPVNEVEQAYLNYAANLCLLNPKPFSIPSSLTGLEKACMRLSFGDYENIDLSEYPLTHRLVGVQMLDGSADTVMFIRCKNTMSKELYRYSNDLEECCESLTATEQSILLVEMIKVYHTEICRDLRRMKVAAYSERILFPKNERNDLIRRVAAYYGVLVSPEPGCLGEWDGEMGEIREVPLIFQSDVERGLADVYYERGMYERALDYYTKHRSRIQAIGCLEKLSRKEDVVAEALVAAREIGERRSFRNGISLCNLYTKLGELTEDTLYFDKAFEAYPSFEPKKAKACFLMRRGRVAEAILDIEKALDRSPDNTELLFLYASALVAIKRYEDASLVFGRLVNNDPRNPELLRNLSMCYLHFDDVRKAMEKLKLASRYDTGLLKEYFLFSVKYDLLDEAAYALERMDGFRYLSEGVAYLVHNELMDVGRIKDALLRNPKLSKDADAILARGGCCFEDQPN
jgi:tetratricopeptide (TPR) repeat protein